jgi:hypothetical protein
MILWASRLAAHPSGNGNHQHSQRIASLDLPLPKNGHAPNHRSSCFGHKRRFHSALLPCLMPPLVASAKPATLDQPCNSKCRNVPEDKWQKLGSAPIRIGCCTAHRCFIIGEIRPCPAGAPLALKRKGRLRMGTHGMRHRRYAWSNGSRIVPTSPLLVYRYALGSCFPGTSAFG